MNGPKPGHSAPQSGPRQNTPQTPEVQPKKEKTPEELKAAALAKKEAGKEKVKKETKGKLGEMLGGDFGLLMKKLFKTFGGFLASFDGIRDKVGNIFAAQSPQDVDKIFKESKDFKVPKIGNPEGKSTTIENPKPDEKLLAYLYRCLKIPVPTKEQIAPKKKLSMKHLISQMWRSFQFAKGKKEIMTGLTQKPQKFYKDDVIFFRNAMNGELTAGFIQEVGDHTVKVTTLDATGTKRTITKYKNMCFMAFHIPGNKSKGAVPVKNKKKPEYKVDSP